MTILGTVRGKTIELDERLPYPEGQKVTVTVEAATDAPPGSPAAVLKAMQSPPHIEPGDVDALEAAIKSGRIPPKSKPILERGRAGEAW